MTVCVVIPTHNRRVPVTRAVESALDQTRPPEEIVVVDDGSVDGTAHALAVRFGSRIEIVRQPNRGVAAARNAGVHATAAPVIALLDSDDTWEPHKLERQCPLMADPAIVLSATNWRRDGADRDEFARLGLPARREVLHLPLRRLTRVRGHALWASTWLILRSAFYRAGGFDERLRVAEDTALLYRLGRSGRFAVHPDVLAVRSDRVDACKLTNYSDPTYLMEATANATAILLDVWSEIGFCPEDVRLSCEHLLTYHLRRDLEYLAMQGRSAEARQRARQVIARRAGLTEMVVALTALVSPALVGRRRRLSLALRGISVPRPAAPESARAARIEDTSAS